MEAALATLVKPRINPVVGKLERLCGSLALETRDLIQGWTSCYEEIGSAKALVREGDRVDACPILLRGMVARCKLHFNGEQQIVSFHYPGDILDIQHLLFEHADHNLRTVTPCQIAWVHRSTIMAAIRTDQELAFGLWSDSLIDASIFREWVLNVARRDALERVAHLLCEIWLRTNIAGLTQLDGSVDYMVTQTDVADATGLTAVHVNRMMRQLREHGAHFEQGKVLSVAHFEALKQIASYSPDYLHRLARDYQRYNQGSATVLGRAPANDSEFR
jgi:CRP-like cAMP-binding protein